MGSELCKPGHLLRLLKTEPGASLGASLTQLALLRSFQLRCCDHRGHGCTLYSSQQQKQPRLVLTQQVHDGEAMARTAPAAYLARVLAPRA